MRFRLRASDLLFGYLVVVYLIALSTIIYDPTPDPGEAALILAIAPIAGLYGLVIAVGLMVTGGLVGLYLGGILLGAILVSAVGVSLIRQGWRARGIQFVGGVVDQTSLAAPVSRSR